jgi:hypothetical protein
MDTITSLLWADGRAIKKWFVHRMYSKLLVAGMFFLLLVGVGGFIWFASTKFFQLLVSYEQFGFITALYVIHASLILIFLFSIASSVAATIGLSVYPSDSLAYIWTLPIRFADIAVWMYIKTISSNFVILSVVFIPIMVSFGTTFGHVTPLFVFQWVLVMITIDMISASIGGYIAFLFSRFFRQSSYIAMTVGFFTFFLTVYGALRLIFPHSMEQLYAASSADFQRIFYALPLNAPYMPGVWIAQFLTNQVNVLTFALISSGMIIAICLAYAVWANFLPQALRISLGLSGNRPIISKKATFLEAQFPITKNEILSFFRNPKEIGYAIFLTALSAFLFAAMKVLGAEGRWMQYQAHLAVFSFGWILFLTAALFLRFVYPLMAREGKRSWYLFSLPLSRRSIFDAKLIGGLLFLVPTLLFAGVAVGIMPFFTGFRILIGIITCISIVTMYIGHVSIGTIAPNFADSEDPEKVSTSGSGIVTLAISIGIAGIGGWGIYQITSVSGNMLMSLVCVNVLFLCINLSLLYSAYHAVDTYEW